MKILTDTHTHTNCSDHAFSTVAENLAMAKRRGLDLICMTDHAPAIPDAPHIWHFSTMHDLPKEVDGVRLLKGIEANVLDDEGHLDVPKSVQEGADMMIASMHTPCYHSTSKEAHTAAWLNVIQNPYVTILGIRDLTLTTRRSLLQQRKPINVSRLTTIPLRHVPAAVRIAAILR